MSERNLGDYAVAQEIIDTMRKIAREEIDRQRPKPRYARVVEIDTENRYAIVNFIGEEDNPVRVPFGSVSPAAVGQEVRIGGTASDRYIEDIRGINDSENRVLNLEDEIDKRQFAMVHARLGSNQNVGDSITKVNLSATDFYPVNFTTDTGGGWTIQVAGYYDIMAMLDHQWRAPSSLSNEGRTYLRVQPSSGSVQTLDYTNFDANFRSSDYGSGTRYFTVVGALAYLNAGDTVYVAHYNNSTRTVYSNGSFIKIRLVAAIDKVMPPETES